MDQRPNATSEERRSEQELIDRFASRHNHPSQAEKRYNPMVGSEPIAHAATGVGAR